MTANVRDLRPDDIAACEHILYSLPDWLGLECARAFGWLHVKTRGPATPDPEYDRTRRSYLAMGYAPLFESLTLWGPENAVLVLVQHLGGSSP